MKNRQQSNELQSNNRQGKPLLQGIFYNNPDGYPPIINGARLIAQSAFAFDLFCRENGQQWQVAYPQNTHIVRIDTRAKSSWQEYWGFVVRVLRQASAKSKLFIGHDMHGFLVARLLATRYRRPLVYHCHDFAQWKHPLPLGSRIVKSFEHQFARSADLVIVPDHERSVVVAKELGLSQSPLIVANAPIHPFDPAQDQLSQTLLTQGRTFSRILFRQGRLGVGHALEATLHSMVNWASPDWSFVVMGWGEEAYLQALRQLASTLGVSERFVILPPVGYDKIAQFTVGAHVGHALYDPIHINNIYITTASNKLMEYMAAGLPLLVSERPGLRRLIEKYQCGIIADESKPDQIAVAVNTLLGDPSLSRRMGASAQRAFVQEFCYERQFAPVLKAFQTLSRC